MNGVSEFFKVLITQFASIWQKLSLQQKILTASLIGFTFLALSSLIFWSESTNQEVKGFKVLYSNLELEESSLIADKLTAAGYQIKYDNGGKTIAVQGDKIYEARMLLAKEGLPSNKGIGYELFDNTNLGVTDFVQKINAKRALQGELQRTIEGLQEVKSARVHLVLPEESIFASKQKPAKASIVVTMNPGRSMTNKQISGITHLVASSVDGLKPGNISILDMNGKLLSSPYGSEDEESRISSRNIELQNNVENKMRRKVETLLEGVLGPQKSQVQLAVDLDFDQIEETLEKYNPESKVVRSEERNDKSLKNAPDGDHQTERSITNYEIDKSIERIIRETGNIKRLTISVAVDGKYEVDPNGGEKYLPREASEITSIEEIVKNSVGYDLARGDQIVVTNIRFDNEDIRRIQQSALAEEKRLANEKWASFGIIAGIIIVCFVVIGILIKSMSKAMNPPTPELKLNLRSKNKAQLTEEEKRNKDLLRRVEALSRAEPGNIASIIKEWLNGKKRVT